MALDVVLICRNTTELRIFPLAIPSRTAQHLYNNNILTAANCSEENGKSRTWGGRVPALRAPRRG